MTRRDFLHTAAAASAAVSAVSSDAAVTEPPWYRRVTRWGQTNITERDPVRVGHSPFSLLT